MTSPQLTAIGFLADAVRHPRAPRCRDTGMWPRILLGLKSLPASKPSALRQRPCPAQSQRVPRRENAIAPVGPLRFPAQAELAGLRPLLPRSRVRRLGSKAVSNTALRRRIWISKGVFAQ